MSDKLQEWFELSYASFLTVPRVLMEQMPEEWQDKMAELLTEYDETFPGVYDLPLKPVVQARNTKTNKFMKWPSWLLNYRYPENYNIDQLRTKQ